VAGFPPIWWRLNISRHAGSFRVASKYFTEALSLLIAAAICWWLVQFAHSPPFQNSSTSCKRRLAAISQAASSISTPIALRPNSLAAKSVVP